MLVQSIANPPLPPPQQHPTPTPLNALRLPARPSSAAIPLPHAHSQLELAALSTHAPASSVHASMFSSDTLGPHANPHAQRYTLATRTEMARRSRRRSRSPAGLVDSSVAHTGQGFGASQRAGAPHKTVNTDLTRYANSSSFRGTTPPQRLRYIYRPARESDEQPQRGAGADASSSELAFPRVVSDGRYRTWEEVPYDSALRPLPWRDERGREWLPVLLRDATEAEYARWEARERRRVTEWEARQRGKAGRESFSETRWVETAHLAHIHPSFLSLSARNPDGSSHLITPTGNRPMTLLDRTLPWSERQYHHVGRDPQANYAAVFGGLQAEQERQAALSAEQLASQEAMHKAMRKEARDYERARRKEEKMRLRFELEVARLEASKPKAAAAASRPATRVIKQVVHKSDGTDETIFVRKTLKGQGRPASAQPPWGSSQAVRRNASRARETAAQTGDAVGGWLDPRTRQESMQGLSHSQTLQHQYHRRSSRSRSRSLSRSTSSSRRRAARRAEKLAKIARREERERKRQQAKLNSMGVQAGSGDMPASAAHPRASEMEAHLLREAQARRQMSLDRLGATLNSLEALSLGGVGASPVGRAGARRRSTVLDARSRSRSYSSSSHSGSSSSSGFTSPMSSRSVSPRMRRHGVHSRSRSRSSSPSRRHRSSKHRKHRSHSHSRSSSSRSRSRSSSVSSSHSRSGKSRRRHHRSSKLSRRDRRSKSAEWDRRTEFEEMDARIRRKGEAHWLRVWEKRYEAARTVEQKRALKAEKREWKERRDMQHTLLQQAHAQSPTDTFLQSPSSAAAAAASGASASPSSSTNAAGVLTDQWGTPIASYGTVYPQTNANLLQQASMLEQYARSAEANERLLDESRRAVEASVGGIEHIVDGLRHGFASKGMDQQAQAAQEKALHASLRAAIRAREDQRKKAAALKQANGHVLDELRRQEAIIMERGQEVHDAMQYGAYAAAARALALQQQQEQWAREEAERQRASRRPRSSPNAQLGDVQGVDPFWYEKKDHGFTLNHVAYNQTLRQQLAQLPGSTP